MLLTVKVNVVKRTSTDVPVSLDFLRKVYHKYGHPKKTLPKKNQRIFLLFYEKPIYRIYILQTT